MHNINIGKYSMITMDCDKRDQWGAVRVMLDNHTTVSGSWKEIHLSRVGLGGYEKDFVAKMLRFQK